MSAQAVAPWTVTADTKVVLEAWVLLMNHVGANDTRLLAIVALSDFNGHPAVVCETCGTGHVMTIAAASSHRRQMMSRHRFTLAPNVKVGVS